MHKHADILKALADGVSWDEFEACLRPSNNWYPLVKMRAFAEGDGCVGWVTDQDEWTIRRKPRTIKVNGYEVPEPVREAPQDGEMYFLAAPDVTDFCYASWWNCITHDTRALERGLIHLTKEAAIAHGKAMCGIDPAT